MELISAPDGTRLQVRTKVAGLDVGTTMAAQSYVDNVLQQVPDPLTTSIEDQAGLPPGHRDLAADGVAEEA